MKAIEIVDTIRAENPEVLGGVTDKKAARVIRSALQQIAKQIEALEDGKLNVAGLGVFRVCQVEVEKDGEKTVIKRVSLRLAAQKV